MRIKLRPFVALSEFQQKLPVILTSHRLKSSSLTVIVIVILLLSSCAPINHEYIKKFNLEPSPQINTVMVMVEYLSLKEDISGYWNFYEDSNMLNQDYLHKVGNDMLQSKGYKLADKYLKTSGLIIDRKFYADHYLNKTKQDRPISPPYIVRSLNLDEVTIQGLESLLIELNKPVSTVMSDYKSYIVNDFYQIVENIKLPQYSAILIIQSYHPKISPFLNFEVGITSSFDGFMDFSGHNIRPTTYAYFIHLDTGDLLWSNKINEITLAKQEKFFLGLPSNISSD